MTKVTIIGIDLAKSTFQLHGAAGNGAVVFRKKLARGKLLPFLAEQPAAFVAVEACASAHDWGREIAALGDEVKLVPPIYVKPFVKRQKNDAADAEAIVEAASRPTLRFVEIKTAEQQGQGMLFRTRDLLAVNEPSRSMRSGDILLSLASSRLRARPGCSAGAGRQRRDGLVARHGARTRPPSPRSKRRARQQDGASSGR